MSGEHDTFNHHKAIYTNLSPTQASNYRASFWNMNNSHVKWFGLEYIEYIDKATYKNNFSLYWELFKFELRKLLGSYGCE